MKHMLRYGIAILVLTVYTHAQRLQTNDATTGNNVV